MSAHLFEAILQGDVRRVRELLASGADPTALQGHPLGWRPLHAAVEAIDVEDAPLALARVLLDYGADVNAADRGGDVTPLLLAMLRGLRDCARLFIAHGAAVDVVGLSDDTPIRLAAVDDDRELADLILARGVGDTIDQPGDVEATTPLGAAARRGHVEMVEKLLAAGADPLARDYDRLTARECARFAIGRASDEEAARIRRVCELLEVAEAEAQAKRGDSTPA